MSDFMMQDSAIDAHTHLIELGGDIDVSNAPAFKQRMMEVIDGGAQQVLIDFSQATFIDSTTLGVLISGVKRLRPSGGWLALVCDDPYITRLFQVTGLDQVFPIHASREAALEELQS